MGEGGINPDHWTRQRIVTCTFCLASLWPLVRWHVLPLAFHEIVLQNWVHSNPLCTECALNKSWCVPSIGVLGTLSQHQGQWQHGPLGGGAGVRSGDRDMRAGVLQFALGKNKKMGKPVK